MPELDFAGLRQDAENAFRPHFETVRHRYRQRRRRRTGLAAVGVACLVLASGALVSQVRPGQGASPGAGGGYVDDKWGIQVGDLDHLYAPYQRCTAGRCTRATTSGRTASTRPRSRWPIASTAASASAASAC